MQEDKLNEKQCKYLVGSIKNNGIEPSERSKASRFQMKKGKKILKKLYMYIQGKRMWNAKMSEDLRIRVTRDKRRENNRKH